MSNTKEICFETTLGEIGLFEKSYTFSRAIEGEGEVKHIHYGDIHTKLPSVINEANILPTITQQDEFQFVNYGDIIIADASEDYKDLGKAVCYLDQEEKKVISGLHTHRLKVDKSKVVPEYLINLFQTSRYRKFVWKMGTGVSVLGLSKSNLSKYPVTFPDIETQKKIGAFFRQFNKKIQLQQEKINLLKEQKKGYMQRIFKQEICFKGKNGEGYPEWKSTTLNKVATKISKKNKDLSVTNVISNSAKNGLISQNDYFDKDIANKENIGGYYVISKGDFVYNPRISSEAPYGPINIYHGDFDGIVSPLYTCFRVENVNREFMYYYFKSSLWYKYIYINGDSGARHDRVSIKDSTFFEMNILLPCKQEQEKIAGFLSDFDRKIQLEQQKLQELQEQKAGFMQQMFV
ncbi:restriction endonuclease subunit S [Bacillus wiedmannii]|uniref:restriction endonuclease subunit S n=1 Tax=Bacillus wiedmannii TaxID=1890302 RepID=UPI000BEF5CE4|nr:restriction endonuclease subunit S [Bacillus wiedmannii]PEL93091.1 hypothetical protein CN626_08785 [Bacillus wiedmannii]